MFEGRLLHGTGVNKTDTPRRMFVGNSLKPSFRQQEIWTLSLKAEVLAELTPKMVYRMGLHPMGLGGPEGDWTGDLLDLFKRFPHLYGDNSALSSLNRARTLKHILPEEIQSRIIHGSDYPVPVSGLGPMLMGKLSWSDYKATGKIPNIIERDYQLKQKMGFNAKTFTRMDELLRRV